MEQIKSDIWKWKDSYSVGVKVIDEDHKILLGLLNEVLEINNSETTEEQGAIKSVIYELMSYTEYHFDREELLMEVCGYPGLNNHKRAHGLLKAQVEELIDGYKKNAQSFNSLLLYNFMESWLSEHIATMDKDYESWMQNKNDIIDKANKSFEDGRH